MSGKTLDPRWDSKDSLLASIRELAATAGGEIGRIGKSDCFEIQIQGKKPVLFALKESGKNQPPHWETPTLWVGVPQPLLNRALEFVDQPIKPHLIILLIDHWDKHLLMIPSNAALGTMVRRERKAAKIHLSFNVKKTVQGYSVQTSRGEPDIEVQDIDTLAPLIALLKEQSTAL